MVIDYKLCGDILIHTTTNNIMQWILTRHNIRLAYFNVWRLVIVFITLDIALAPSSPMDFS